MTDEDGLTSAIVVYREDDHWEAEMLPVALTSDLRGLLQALRQQPSSAGTIGLVAVGDDFFVALRVFGERVSVFLSDITASWEWPLARQVLDFIDIPVPEEEELDSDAARGRPVGLRRPRPRRDGAGGRCQATATSTPTRCCSASPPDSDSATPSNAPSTPSSAEKPRDLAMPTRTNLFAAAFLRTNGRWSGAEVDLSEAEIADDVGDAGQRGPRPVRRRARAALRRGRGRMVRPRPLRGRARPPGVPVRRPGRGDRPARRAVRRAGRHRGRQGDARPRSPVPAATSSCWPTSGCAPRCCWS